MANLTEHQQWDDVYQLETTDPALAGPGGIMNRQAQELLNRTTYLKAALDAVAEAIVSLGTGKQDADLTLSAIAGLATAADKMPYFTGADQASLATLTPFARTLLDDPDAVTALRTLGVYDAITASMAPVGSVSFWPKSTPPSGWLIRDGSAVSRTAYAELFDVLGTAYGSGDGSTTFNLPDDRGLAPVGYKSGDSAFGTFGGSVGSTDAVVVSHAHTTSTDGAHQHGYTQFTNNGGSNGSPDAWGPRSYTTWATGVAGDHIHTISSSGVSGINANIQPSRIYLPIIKF